MEPAAIVLFVYNRPSHTEQILQSLAANHLASRSELIVYIDGPKQGASVDQLNNIEKVKTIIKAQHWCKKLTINVANANQGLANSIIKGVTDTLQHHERIIVLEDDMVVSPYFLDFMNEGLAKYANAEEVISIHGYCLPINFSEPAFFLRGADCWGWATWERGWKLFNPDARQLMKQLKKKRLLYEFDFFGTYDYSGMLQKQVDKKIDSWAIRWYASAFLNNKLTLYPSQSLVQNMGYDGSGTHKQNERQTRTNLNKEKVYLKDIPMSESLEARLLISKYLSTHLTFKQKIRKFIRGIAY
jgi:hypothetical protein